MAHYEFSIFIGRFQPFHNGHFKVVEKALSISDRLIIFIGSSNKSRSARNPFTAIEREEMIRAALKERLSEMTIENKIIFYHLEDKPYDRNGWIENIQEVVFEQTGKSLRGRNSRVTLIGHNKDESSYYLSLFPQWDTVDVAAHFKDEDILDATWLRDSWYHGHRYGTANEYYQNLAVSYIPPVVLSRMIKFSMTPEFATILSDDTHIKDYKAAWGNKPFPPTFNTVDCVVIQAGHVLVVERADSPGKGLKALPGGFLDVNEFLEQSAIRELKEETRIDIPPAVLQSRIKARQTFDDPHRSERGRTVTHAFLIDLGPEIHRQVAQGKKPEFTAVKGGSDAKKAYWMPIAQMKPQEFFEDHYHIIHAMLDAGNERY